MTLHFPACNLLILTQLQYYLVSHYINKLMSQSLAQAQLSPKLNLISSRWSELKVLITLRLPASPKRTPPPFHHVYVNPRWAASASLYPDRFLVLFWKSNTLIRNLYTDTYHFPCLPWGALIIKKPNHINKHYSLQGFPLYLLWGLGHLGIWDGLSTRAVGFDGGDLWKQEQHKGNWKER